MGSLLASAPDERVESAVPDSDIPMRCMTFFSTDPTIANKTALIEGARRVSYSDLYRMTIQAAIRLQNAGIRPGDRVAIIAVNSIGYVSALLALWHLQAIACPLDRRLPPVSIAARVQESGCRFVLKGNDSLMESALPNVKHLCFEDIFSFCDSVEQNYQISTILETSYPATIIYTTGSSSVPKAALHLLKNHWMSALGSNEHLPVDPDTKWLLALPLYHVSGLAVLFRTLPAGAGVVVVEQGEHIVDAIVRNRVSHISVVATQLSQITKSAEEGTDLSFVKIILAGGSAMPPRLVERAVSAGLPLYLSYGSTEMSSQIATTSCITDPAVPPHYRVLAHREVILSNAGEILVKGETLFCGFVTGKEHSLPFDNDRWYRTGDRGCLYGPGILGISGRLDRMFISGGENIQPEEIERILASFLSIVQALVVPVPDERYGFRPVAFVLTEIEPEKGFRNKVKSFLATQLPSYKIPDEFYSMPQGASDGLKLDYKSLQKRALSPAGLQHLP